VIEIAAYFLPQFSYITRPAISGMEGCCMTSIFASLSAAITWLRSASHMDTVYLVLAAALLLELTIRVLRRFVADRRVQRAASESNQRVSARLRKVV
jgi:hypothetical protein